MSSLSLQQVYVCRYIFPVNVLSVVVKDVLLSAVSIHDASAACRCSMYTVWGTVQKKISVTVERPWHLVFNFMYLFYGVAVLKWPNLPAIKTQPSLYICYRIAGPFLIVAVVTLS